MSQPQGHSAARRIMSKKNSNNTIGNWTRDLPACTTVPQATAPCAQLSLSIPKESHVTLPVHEHTTINTPPSLVHVRKLSATRSQSVSMYLPYHMTSHKIATLTLYEQYRDIIKVSCSKDVSTQRFNIINPVCTKHHHENLLLWADSIQYNFRHLYCEQNSSDIPADSSTLSRRPHIPAGNSAISTTLALKYTSTNLITNSEFNKSIFTALRTSNLIPHSSNNNVYLVIFL